ncbi:MAG: hypothetical protein ACYCXN_11420 [Acidimicrobiales bacterium]
MPSPLETVGTRRDDMRNGWWSFREALGKQIGNLEVHATSE